MEADQSRRKSGFFNSKGCTWLMMFSKVHAGVAALQPPQQFEAGTVRSVFIRPAPIDFVIELVNAWSPIVRAAAEDHSPYPELEDLCESHAVQSHRRISSATIAALAEEVHHVFAAASDPIEVLSDLVIRIDATVAIDGEGAGWQVPADQWLRGTILAGLVEHARTDRQLDRLDVCTAHRCADTYLDATQAATKKYCSSTCQTRAKAAARRSRLASSMDGARQ
ncbi:hypothetical protein BH24ACT5_BH24ACT5_18410 [soil metagenome]